MKKFLSMLLTVAIVLSTLCLPAVAAEGETTATAPEVSLGTIGNVEDSKAYIAATYPEGTSATAIATLADLQAIANNAEVNADNSKYLVSGTYYLTADIVVTIDGDEDPTFPLVFDTAEIPAAEEGADPKILNLGFTGTLDGCGYDIKFVYENGASLSFDSGIGLLFNNAGGTVKNLTVDGATFSATSTSGVISASASTGSALRFENVAITNSNITGKGGNVGSFIGTTNHGITFVNCAATGTISSTANVGGFVGKAETAGTLNVLGCVADVTLKSTGSNVGGVLGLLTAGTKIVFGKGNDVPTAKAEPQYANTIKITTPSGTKAHVGGLIGGMDNKAVRLTNKKTTLANGTEISYKQGDCIVQITGTNTVVANITTTGRAGGLMGYVANVSQDLSALGSAEHGIDPIPCLIEIGQNATVYGTITATNRAGGLVGQFESNYQLRMARYGTQYAPTNKANVTGAYGTGGIVGLVGSSGAKTYGTTVVLNAVVNEGKITDKHTSSRMGDAAGGLIGSVGLLTAPEGAPGLIEIKGGAKNTGAVSGISHAGGIVGELCKLGNFNVSITNATNEGTVTSTSATKEYVVGGIMGAIGAVGADHIIDDSVSVSFKNCVNSGAISFDAAVATYLGGILGNVNSNGVVDIANCINKGGITGPNTDSEATMASFGGGIVGYATATPTINVTNCHNAGSIEFLKNVGGVIGKVETALTLNISNFSNSAFMQGKCKSGASQGILVGLAADAAWSINAANCTDFGTANTKATSWVRLAGAATTAGRVANTVNCQQLKNVAYTGPENTASFFSVLEGARIRVSSQGITDNGIRFDIAVDEALVEALVAAGYNKVEFHSLMALASSVNAMSFNKETLADMGENFSDSKTAATVKDDGTYAAALINFSAEQYATEFACVGYLVATNGEETITLYTAYDADNARSIAYVADAALKDNANGQYNAYKTVLESFAQWLPAAN